MNQDLKLKTKDKLLIYQNNEYIAEYMLSDSLALEHGYIQYQNDQYIFHYRATKDHSITINKKQYINDISIILEDQMIFTISTKSYKVILSSSPISVPRLDQLKAKVNTLQKKRKLQDIIEDKIQKNNTDNTPQPSINNVKRIIQPNILTRPSISWIQPIRLWSISSMIMPAMITENIDNYIDDYIDSCEKDFDLEEDLAEQKQEDIISYSILFILGSIIIIALSIYYYFYAMIL